MLKLWIICLALWCLHGSSTYGYQPLMRPIFKTVPIPKDAGDALYLTPYINNGEIELAREMSNIKDPLKGISNDQQPDNMHSGFFTVNEDKGNHMFFWFIPATDVDPATAPTAMWLQGGPGASSLFGLLEVNGHFRAVYDDAGSTTAEMNPDSWCKVANMIYVDNPVGAGFSYTEKPSGGGFPKTQDDVADDLYEFLTQFFILFPEFRKNEFFVFGESYAGKFVPTISRRIHEENENAAEDRKINLQGLGIGDGWMSPPDSAIYAEFLYGVGLLDDAAREEALELEEKMRQAANAGDYFKSWEYAIAEQDLTIREMGCDYYYGIDICDTPKEEDNYEDYVNLESVRKALHVGNRPFGHQGGLVYDSMIAQDFMKSGMDNVEFLLDRYPVLLYDGNFDIICNHYGILQMFKAMTTWSKREDFFVQKSHPYKVDKDTVGYVKNVGYLSMVVMRNSGHYVPRTQGPGAFSMFSDFITNKKV